MMLSAMFNYMFKYKNCDAPLTNGKQKIVQLSPCVSWLVVVNLVYASVDRHFVLGTPCTEFQRL